ncbi:MAG: alpha/beta hydrolase [Chromatiaceae bacterium]|nr:MAG: alpha/beta hydrolase [Chromatiaceae bacterium]
MSPRLVRTLLAALLLPGLWGGAGCAGGPRALMPTPTIFQEVEAAAAIFAAVPPARREPAQDLLFITNRAPATDGPLPYGERRSMSLAFGSAQVLMRPGLTWEALTQLSQSGERSPRVSLELGPVREVGRFPEEPYRLNMTPAGVVRDAAMLAAHRQARDDLRTEVRRRLQAAPSGKVILYVHGFNETLASAAYTAAELCHFFGRTHLCAFFTWPASSTGNLLTSFTQTTESAQFSVGHLRQTIRALAQIPEVEGIHLLAHSRGAALLLSALRELHIEAIAAGQAPAEAFKIEQVVLMSADIDAEVASQQILIFGSDPDMLTRWDRPVLPELFRGRLTVYTSPQDRALLVSRTLFRSGNRIGQLTPEQIRPSFIDLFDRFGRMDLVVYEGRRTDFFGHSSFTSNPRVSADLVELIRNGSAPDDPARNLISTGPISWGFPQEVR